MTDNRGIELHVGQRVVYNWQGQMAYGQIQQIVPSVRYHRHRHIFKVFRLFPVPINGRNEMSLVRDEKSLMVVFEDEYQQ